MNLMLNRTCRKRTFSSQQGITMIEVLVTVFVCSIGLLGTAALQLMALKGSMDSSQRIAATSIVSAVVDRLKANAEGRQANDYASAFAAYAACSKDTLPPAMICSDYYSQGGGRIVDSASCNGTELALFDAWELSCGYVNQDNNINSPVDFLVNPTISVTCSDSDTLDSLACSDNSIHQIMIRWFSISRDARQNQELEQQSITVNAGI